MGGEQATLLEPHETYVCGNVLLSLNILGAFKLMKGNTVEHDSTVVKQMQLKIDPRGQDVEFLTQLMKDPAQFLPNKEQTKEEVEKK